jgi:hypothetical protein
VGEGDSKIMCQLLGLTNKAEVLENEEFFRIAWEYQFDGAEMPHSNAVMYSSDVPCARVNSSLRLIWLVDGGRWQRTQGHSLVPAGATITASTLRRCRIWSRRSGLIGLRRRRSTVSPHSFYFILFSYDLGVGVLCGYWCSFSL